MRIIISGGGTGGHLYPALAIGRAFRDKGAELLYVGSSHGIEKEIMPGETFAYQLLPVMGISKKNGLKLAKSLWFVQKSYGMAKKIVREFKPDLAIGTGGYAAYPILKAAAAYGAKTMVHEANAELGLANRRLAPVVDCLCLNYSNTAQSIHNAKRIELVGMPIRGSIKSASRKEGGVYTGAGTDRLLVVVTGGSQGSQHINEAMAGIYRDFGQRQDICFYHITGRPHLEACAGYGHYGNVKLIDYEERMDLVLARTDICIGRAGASFLAEISCRGLPAILVPYPYSGGHQEKNAAYFEGKGAALMVLDRDLPQGLERKFARLAGDEVLRAQMAAAIKKEARTDALERIVKIGLGLLRQ